LGINAGGPNHADGIGDVVGAEPTSKDDGRAQAPRDVSADAPIVRDAQGADLPVISPVTVQQHEIGNALVALGDGDAWPPAHPHAAHDWHAANGALELQNLPAAPQ